MKPKSSAKKSVRVYRTTHEQTSVLAVFLDNLIHGMDGSVMALAGVGGARSAAKLDINRMVKSSASSGSRSK